MPKFTKLQTEKLKAYLYNSNIHDAKIETMSYDGEKRKLIIVAVNSILNDVITFVFEDVEIILYTIGNEIGSHKTIISLTVEEEYSYIKNYIRIQNNSHLSCIYMLFQMLSGDELHIVSTNVFIENVR